MRGLAHARGQCPKCNAVIDTRGGTETQVPNGIRFTDVKCANCGSLWTIELMLAKALEGALQGLSIDTVVLDEFALRDRMAALLPPKP